MDKQRTDLCFVIINKDGLSLFKCTRPECHVSMSKIRSYERESNCVQFLDDQIFFVV